MAVINQTLAVFLVAALALALALAGCAAAADAEIRCIQAESATVQMPQPAKYITVYTNSSVCYRGVRNYTGVIDLKPNAYIWGVASIDSNEFAPNLKCGDKYTKPAAEASGDPAITTICTCCTDLCNENLPCSDIFPTAPPSSTGSYNFASPLTLLVASTAVFASKIVQ